MKMRVFAAASILLTVVLVAAISHAAPSCCDPKNGSDSGSHVRTGSTDARHYSRCLAATARCGSPGYPCYGQSNRQQLERAGATKAGCSLQAGGSPERSRRTELLCWAQQQRARKRNQSRDSGPVSWLWVQWRGRWPGFIFGFSAREWPRSVYLESTEHRSTGLPCGPSELLPNDRAQQQSGWLERIAAYGLPRALVIRILE